MEATLKENQLEEILNRKHLTAQWLGEETGLSVISIDYLIRQAAVPKPRTAIRIARALDVRRRDIWPSFEELGAKDAPTIDIEAVLASLSENVLDRARPTPAQNTADILPAAEFIEPETVPVAATEHALQSTEVREGSPDQPVPSERSARRGRRWNNRSDRRRQQPPHDRSHPEGSGPHGAETHPHSPQGAEHRTQQGDNHPPDGQQGKSARGSRRKDRRRGGRSGGPQKNDQHSTTKHSNPGHAATHPSGRRSSRTPDQREDHRSPDGREPSGEPAQGAQPSQAAALPHKEPHRDGSSGGSSSKVHLSSDSGHNTTQAPVSASREHHHDL